MNTLILRITPHGKLLLGTESSNSNFIDSAEFIPGSMLRGCIGEALHATLPSDHDAELCSDENCLFCAIFRDERIGFGFAYLRTGQGRSWPLPLTARSCKRYPGFARNKQAQPHGVHDLLLSELAWSLANDPLGFSGEARLALALADTVSWQQQRRAVALEQTQHTCGYDGCDQPLKPLPVGLRNYGWRQGQTTAVITAAPSPPIERRTHVGINRARMVAEDSLLFTQTALDFVEAGGGNEFLATVRVPAELEQLLRSKIPQQTTIGRGRSRGYGDISLKVGDVPDGYPTVAERLGRMQERFHEALRVFDPGLAERLSGTVVTLTLRSPAIMTERSVPVRFPQPATVDLPSNTVPLRAWARTEIVGGWDGAMQMPKRTRLALRAGSVLCYFVPDAVDSAELLTSLQQIENDGIGSDRGSGYGETTVCADFHVTQARI